MDVSIGTYITRHGMFHVPGNHNTEECITMHMCLLIRTWYVQMSSNIAYYTLALFPGSRACKSLGTRLITRIFPGTYYAFLGT